MFYLKKLLGNSQISNHVLQSNWCQCCSNLPYQLCDEFSRTKADWIVLATIPICSNQTKIYSGHHIATISSVRKLLHTNKLQWTLLRLPTPLRLHGCLSNSSQSNSAQIRARCFGDGLFFGFLFFHSVLFFCSETCNHGHSLGLHNA